jgi:predicted nucleotidyltransferase
MPAFDPTEMIGTLTRHGVEFVFVGGVAASIYNSAYVTLDADICYARTPENLKKLAAALRELGAEVRGAPRGLPFLLDEKTLAMGLNFTFETKFGSLDILGEIAGVGTYQDMIGDAKIAEVFKNEVKVLSLPKLIASKKAVGRPKDEMLLLELELLLKARASLDQAESAKQGRAEPKRNGPH